MKTQIISTIAASMFTIGAFADVEVSNSSRSHSPKNAAVAGCVDAVKGYHARDARLFLNNKAGYREVDGTRFITVKGWVWRNGERVKVTHECSNFANGGLAMHVQFDDETQVATR
ncbi:MAG: hypothetical protein AAF529_04770 [Pseudomonadota bacterium]